MAKFEKKICAREMRKKGISILVIAKELNVTKGSVSLWCRDILLSSQQVEILRKQKGSVMGRWIGAETNRKKKQEAVKKADVLAIEEIGKLSQRDLLLIATALYWSEGSKADSTSTYMFINSDPSMILLVKNFLVQGMDICNEDIVCTIQINRIHEPRIQVVLSFWKKLLHLKSSQIRKPYFVNTVASKVYENHNSYYGVCRLSVKKSKYLKYRMLGLIKAIRSAALPA